MSAVKKQKGAGQTVVKEEVPSGGGEKRKQAGKPVAAPAAAAGQAGQGKKKNKAAKKAAAAAAAAASGAPAKKQQPKQAAAAAAGGNGEKKGVKKEKVKKEVVKTEPEDDDDEGVSEEDLKRVGEAQNALEAVYAKQTEEVEAIERKYNKLRRPAQKARDAVARNLKGFWAQAFAKHELISGIVDSEVDSEILGSLIALDVDENEDYKTGMRITMEFGDNKYFTTKKITREYKVPSDPDGEAIVTITPKVQWKDPAFPDAEENKTSFFVNWLHITDEPHAEIAEVIRDEIYRDPLDIINRPDDIPHQGDDSDDDDAWASLAAEAEGDDDEE